MLTGGVTPLQHHVFLLRCNKKMLSCQMKQALQHNATMQMTLLQPGSIPFVRETKCVCLIQYHITLNLKAVFKAFKNSWV